jgi:hypothetical protein
MVKRTNALVGIREGKRPLRRPRRRWNGNMKMVWRALLWLRIGARGAPFVNTVMNLLVQ